MQDIRIICFCEKNNWGLGIFKNKEYTIDIIYFLKVFEFKKFILFFLFLTVCILFY